MSLWYSKNCIKITLTKALMKKHEGLSTMLRAESFVEPERFQKDYKDLMLTIQEIDTQVDSLINIEVHFMYNIKIFLICFEKLHRKIIMNKRKEEYRSLVGIKSKEELSLQRMCSIPRLLAQTEILLECKYREDVVDCKCDYCNPEEWAPLDLGIPFTKPLDLITNIGTSSAITSTGTCGSYDPLKVKHVSFKTEDTVHELSDRDPDSRIVFLEMESRKPMNNDYKHLLQSFFGYDSTDLYSWDLVETDMFFF